MLILGIVTGFNLLVIVYKFNSEREAEAVLDLVLFAVIVYIMSGAGQGGMFVGMVASAVVSTVLYFSPPKFLESETHQR